MIPSDKKWVRPLGADLFSGGEHEFDKKCIGTFIKSSPCMLKASLSTERSGAFWSDCWQPDRYITTKTNAIRTTSFFIIHYSTFLRATNLQCLLAGTLSCEQDRTFSRQQRIILTIFIQPQEDNILRVRFQCFVDDKHRRRFR